MTTARFSICRPLILSLPLIALAALLPNEDAKAAGQEQKVQMAQVQLQFGPDARTIVGHLHRQGYRDITIINQKITRTRVEACRGSTRLEMDIAHNGQIIRQKQIGTCGQLVDIHQARKILRRSGYSDIILNPAPGGFLGAACKNGTRSSVSVSSTGHIREIGTIGGCGKPVTKDSVHQDLRRQGYDRIKFEDYPPPPFIVSACKGAHRVDLIVAADGRIWREQRSGICEPALQPGQVTAFLKKKGYRRIKLLNSSAPYRAEACKGRDHFKLTIGSFRGIVKAEKIGLCAKHLDANGIYRKLGNEGFSRVHIQQKTDTGYLVYACEAEKRVAMTLNAAGQLQKKTVVDLCQSPTFDAIGKDMKQRGFGLTHYYVDVCDKKKHLRIKLNKYGAQVGLKEIGRCK